MNRLSLRNNRLKSETIGGLPIILEESMEYISNEWKQNQKMWTCNRLDSESLRSWPTMSKNFPGTGRWRTVGDLDVGSGISKGPHLPRHAPMSQVILFHVGFVWVNFGTKREDESFENRPLIIGDSVLAAPIQKTEYCHSRLEYCRALHIYLSIGVPPTLFGLHTFGSSHVSRVTFWH